MWRDVGPDAQANKPASYMVSVLFVARPGFATEEIDKPICCQSGRMSRTPVGGTLGDGAADRIGRRVVFMGAVSSLRTHGRRRASSLVSPPHTHVRTASPAYDRSEDRNFRGGPLAGPMRTATLANIKQIASPTTRCRLQYPCEFIDIEAPSSDPFWSLDMRECS